MAAIARQDSAQRQQMSAHCFKTVCMAPSCATAMRSHSAAHASQVSAQTRHVSRGGAPPADNSYSSAETPEKLCPFPSRSSETPPQRPQVRQRERSCKLLCGGVIRASCPLRDGTVDPGEERRGVRGIAGVGLAECCEGFPLFPSGQAHVHHHQDGEHHQGRACGPLEEEAEHDQDKARTGGGARRHTRLSSPPGASAAPRRAHATPRRAG